MKNVIVRLSLPAMVTGLLMAVSSMVGSPSAALADPGTICVGDPIPAGYVVVGTSVTANCPSNAGYENTHQLDVPRDGLTVCMIPTTSPVPAGYVVTRSLVSVACISNAGYENAHVITVPFTGVTACLYPTYIGIPLGFVLDRWTTSGDCISNAGYANARVLRAA